MLVKGNNRLINGIRNILLIQIGDIGDVVLSLPTIRALRENFPQIGIVVAVREKAKEIIEDCPWATDVVSINQSKRKWFREIAYQTHFFSHLRKYHCDLAIDLRTGTRGAILALLSGARQRIGRFDECGHSWSGRVFTHLVRPENELNQYSAEHNLNIILPFHVKIGSRLPDYMVPNERKERALGILKQTQVSLEKPFVVIHPFSLWKYKELSINQSIFLCDHIASKYDFSVIITGSAEERRRAREVVAQCNHSVFNLAGETSIGELAGVLHESQLFIGVDTAALHLAAAVGTPTIGIFGPSSPTNWAPRGNRHCVISKKMPCIPCMQKGCQNSETSRCLEDLTFEEISKKLDQHIELVAV